MSTLITTIPLEIWNRSADLADKPPYKLRYTDQRWLISYLPCPALNLPSATFESTPLSSFIPWNMHTPPARRRE